VPAFLSTPVENLYKLSPVLPAVTSTFA